jgi:LPS sulfotransferase NodH
MKNQPFTSFAIFGAMRSGSNLLEKFLNQYEGLHCHGEIFHPFFIGQQGCQAYLSMTREERDKDPAKMLAALKKVSFPKIAGYRIFQTHNEWAINEALTDPYCAKIVLKREPLESFISLKIALETNQWLISEYAHQRDEKIHFDLEEYEIYLDMRAKFYTEIFDKLHLNGQPFLEIDYQNLTDVESVNRIAEFIGNEGAKERLEHPIKRQNPGPLSSKILNYDEVKHTAIFANHTEQAPPILTPVREENSDISRIYFCKSKNMALCPIPAIPDAGLRSWLQFHDGRPPENGLNMHRFREWRHLHPSALCFSMVRHPVLRAYTAFMRKIFATGSDAYTIIRQDLEGQFGMMLPQGDLRANHDRADLEARGYGADEHRISFKLYLVFVAENLANKTKIRQDGMWQLQKEILRRYQLIVRNLLIFKEETIESDLIYFQNRMALQPNLMWKPEPEHQFAFSLSEIYDAEIEHLANLAYAPDYEAFAFEALSRL